MTDFRTARSIGGRIQAARKDRGYRTPADLAAAIPGGMVKESTLQNVEAGRKAELTVSQLLNIAFALQLPPAFLLAPLGSPDGKLDLAYLSDGLAAMTVDEFESWLSGNTTGAYKVTNASEHRDRSQLQALRELEAEVRERNRLGRILELEKESDIPQPESPPTATATKSRLDATTRRIDQLVSYLKSAGWDVGRLLN